MCAQEEYLSYIVVTVVIIIIVPVQSGANVRDGGYWRSLYCHELHGVRVALRDHRDRVCLDVFEAGIRDSFLEPGPCVRQKILSDNKQNDQGDL